MYSGYTTQQGPTQLSSYTTQSDYPTQLGGYHSQGYPQLPGYHQPPGYYPDPTKGTIIIFTVYFRCRRLKLVLF